MIFLLFIQLLDIGNFVKETISVQFKKVNEIQLLVLFLYYNGYILLSFVNNVEKKLKMLE